MKLSGNQEVLLTDTVGFIRKLPHHLIDAFRSTLEEAKYADCILHVVDAANPDAEKQMFVVYDTLRGLGIEDKPVITVFNKADKPETDRELKDLKAEKTVYISAKSGDGCGMLLNIMEEIIRSHKILIEHTFDYAEGGMVEQIRKKGELLSEEYLPEGIRIKAYVPKDLAGKILHET